MPEVLIRLVVAACLAGSGMGQSVRAGETATCLTSVNGVERVLSYDPDAPEIRAGTSLRERAFGGPKGIDCPGIVTLRTILADLDPGQTAADTAPFCLRFDAARATYVGVAAGERTGRMLCKAPGRSLCQRVHATRDAGRVVMGLGTRVIDGLDTAARAAGVTAAVTGTGATIISGPAGYLSGAFASLGAGAVSVLSAPATLTATAVTVLVIGSAVYACGG